MDTDQLEVEARKAAAKHVSMMLQRPDQLEKIEQYRRKVMRKKGSVEAMLKTAMQSQLNGVRCGLTQLQESLQDIKDIKQNLQDVEKQLEDVPALTQRLQHIREENIKYSQYAIAMENLKHIFNVPELVEKTKARIDDGKLLFAHQSLTDLENSRDDLLFELHKQSTHSQTDRELLKQYFSEVDKLSDQLAKQLFLILRRTLNTVRKEPTIIVTALRIIEREERMDGFALQRQRSSGGFLAPGRPKLWRRRAFDVLETSVRERIEGNQFEERCDNRMWLVRHLEVSRQIILEDLRVVKTLCVPCFPPDYDIVNKFVKMYHDSLSKHLKDTIAGGLEGNEYVSLLTWLRNTYESVELLGHPDLNINCKELGPLLDKAIVDDLQLQYMKNMENNYHDWIKNALETETRDWRQDIEPESDGDGYFHTSVPVIVFKMVDENLQVAKTIGQDVVLKVLVLSLDMVTKFGKNYHQATLEFKTRYFTDRSKIRFFTHYMVAGANNCLHFLELAHQLKNRYWRPGDERVAEHFDHMTTFYKTLRLTVLGFLLDEAFMDLEAHFQDLMTRKWMTSTVPVDTICVTMEDYCNDYKHLRPKNFDDIMEEAQKRTVRNYVLSVLQERIQFKLADERRVAADKLAKEAEQVKQLMIRLAPHLAKVDTSYDIVASMAEVLKITDTEMISLELSGMVRKYPDMTADHISALLSVRGDIGRLDLRQFVAGIIPDTTDHQRIHMPKSLFSSIQLTNSLF